MTNQQIVALGRMWPNGHPEAIGAAIGYIRDTQPDRVIATAGATESVLRALRDSYDGWIGVHVSKASICRQYGAERLQTAFEFAPGWVTYSGPLKPSNPNMSVLTTAKSVKKSVVSATSGDFQICSYTTGVGAATSTLTGVGIGRLCSDAELSKHNIGFAHVAVTDSEVDVAFATYQKGVLRPPYHDFCRLRANDTPSVVGEK